MLRQLAARDMAILIDLPALLLPRNGGGDDDDRGGGDGSEGARGATTAATSRKVTTRCSPISRAVFVCASKTRSSFFHVLYNVNKVRRATAVRRARCGCSTSCSAR